MPATTLPVVEGGRPPDGPVGADREGNIRAGVLAALGRPDQLFRVVVVPLWGDHFRVNVVTGDDPSSVRIPHSFFVAADGRGNIIKSTPSIQREYPLSP
jgi:hypothetical protein